ncbi:MAG TPA: host attachment protein [Burkholderiaceae bacterium]|nr:host attachment protein [Burkholderiaceae bacterium]
MEPMWIVLADEGRAQILERREPGQDLEEVEELTDAAARADNADLRRDAFGRRGGSDLRMGGNATSSAGEEKLDHEAERFARRVAERLAEAQRQHRYSQLRIAAAPKFLGRLRKVLDAQVEQAVIDEIDKDLLQLDRRSLTERLFPSPPAAGS